YGMALVGAGRNELAREFAQRLESLPSSPLVHHASHALVEALMAVGRGDPAWACERLLQVRPTLVAIGGRHAQRDVSERTLTACAVRADRRELVQELLAERLARRPTNRWAQRTAAAIAA